LDGLNFEEFIELLQRYWHNRRCKTVIWNNIQELSQYQLGRSRLDSIVIKKWKLTKDEIRHYMSADKIIEEFNLLN
jgi:hypothetical protein